MTNLERIQKMNVVEMAEFLSETTSCDFCKIQCDDKQFCPSLSSCGYRLKCWLNSECEVFDE